MPEFLFPIVTRSATIEEFGVPLYFSLWRGLWAPAGTPKDIIAKLKALSL